MCYVGIAAEVCTDGSVPGSVRGIWYRTEVNLGTRYGSPLKHPLSYPNCTPSTLTTRLPALKTRNNHIFGMPAALTAPLSTLNYWFRGLKLLAFQLNFSVL
jgi:hypothetical protein